MCYLMFPHGSFLVWVAISIASYSRPNLVEFKMYPAQLELIIKGEHKVSFDEVAIHMW